MATYTETTHGIYNEIQRHLLENTVDNGVTWQLHTATEIHNYLNHRIARFLLETGMIQTRATVAVTAGTAAATLASTVILLRRVVWVPDAAGTHTPLIKQDAFALDNGRVGWPSESADPLFYIEEPLNRQTIELVPNPDEDGDLHVVTVNVQTALGTSDVTLPIPATFTPYLKWGVLADCLKKEGEASDPIRADYCEQRWQEGVELAKLMMGVLA